MNECIWKDLNIDNRYEVSNLGEIRNKKSNKILKQKDYISLV